MSIFLLTDSDRTLVGYLLCTYWQSTIGRKVRHKVETVGFHGYKRHQLSVRIRLYFFNTQFSDMYVCLISTLHFIYFTNITQDVFDVKQQKCTTVNIRNVKFMYLENWTYSLRYINCYIYFTGARETCVRTFLLISWHLRLNVEYNSIKVSIIYFSY